MINSRLGRYWEWLTGRHNLKSGRAKLTLHGPWR